MKQVSNFEEVKNRPWYKRLLNSLTLQSKDRKRVLEDIRSLSTLQQLFIKVCQDNFYQLNQDIRTTIMQVMENRQAINDLNQDIEKLFFSFMKYIDSQDDPGSLDPEAQQILLYCLSMHKAKDENRCALENYRRAVAERTGQQLPNSVDPKRFDSLSNVEVKVIYRCMLELNYLDNCTDNPENEADSDIFNHLAISRASQDEIKAEVVKEIETFGLKYLQLKYAEVKISINPEELLWTEERESEGIAPEEEIPKELLSENTIPESDTDCEQITVSSILHIPENEELIYEGKSVHINSLIHCEGRLLFRNSIVHINEGDVPSHIQVETTGIIGFDHCRFICHNRQKESAFIDIQPTYSEAEYSYSETKDEMENSGRIIFFKACVFENCSNFISAKDMCIKFSSCKFLDSGYFFLSDCHYARFEDCTFFNLRCSFLSNCKRSQFDNCMFSFSAPELPTDTEEEKNCFHIHSFILESEFITIKNCQCTGYISHENLVSKEADQTISCLYDSECTVFCFRKEIIVENCYFSKIAQIFKGDDHRNYSRISKTTFSNCSAILLGEHVKIEDCSFIDCTQAVNLWGWPLNSNDLSEFLHCKFDNCFGCTIKVTSFCSNWRFQISYCDFNGWKETRTSSHLLPSESMILIRGSDDSNTIKIDHCIFTDCIADNSFLIGSEACEYLFRDLTSIEDCNFSSCSAKRESGVIVNRYSSYWGGLFKNKRKQQKIVNVKSCTGIPE